MMDREKFLSGVPFIMRAQRHRTNSDIFIYKAGQWGKSIDKGGEYHCLVVKVSEESFEVSVDCLGVWLDTVIKFNELEFIES